MEEKEKKTGILRKLWRGISYVASALILPIDLKFRDKKTKKWKFSVSLKPLKFAIFTAVYYVIQPLSVFFFPTAEKILKQEGLDPKITQNITPVPAGNMRIIPNNAAGKAYALFSSPPIFSPFQFYDNVESIFDENIRGFQGGMDAGFLPRLISPGLETIYLKENASFIDKDSKEMKEIIEIGSGGTFIYLPPLTGREYAEKVLLHEIRHTNPENRKLGPLFCEADADYIAIIQLALARHDTTLLQKFLDAKLIVGSDADHSDELYLYYKFNRMSLPTEQEMRQANIESQPVMGNYLALTDNRLVGDTAAVDSLSKKFAVEVAKLSPLAALRVRLYQDALLRSIVPNNKGAKPSAVAVKAEV